MPRIRTYVHPKDINHKSKQNLSEYIKIYNDGLYTDSICYGELAIQEYWPSEQIKRLAAAFISYRSGLSLQHTYNKYMKEQVPFEERTFKLDRIIEIALCGLDDEISATYAFLKEEDSPEGEFFAGISLLKALSPLRSAHHAAQRGYLLEPLTLVRLALEIIAWSRGCLDLPEGSEYLQVETKFSISLSRKTIPGLARLYGTLSKFAHWHPDVHLNFVYFDETTSVITQSLEFKFCSLLAVSTGYVMAYISYSALMRKYWPNVDISECKISAQKIVDSMQDLIKKTEEGMRLQKLLLDLLPSWELAISHLKEE